MKCRTCGRQAGRYPYCKQCMGLEKKLKTDVAAALGGAWVRVDPPHDEPERTEIDRLRQDSQNNHRRLALAQRTTYTRQNARIFTKCGKNYIIHRPSRSGSPPSPPTGHSHSSYSPSLLFASAIISSNNCDEGERPNECKTVPMSLIFTPSPSVSKSLYTSSTESSC